MREALCLPRGQTPFPWQIDLLDRFAIGTIDRSLDIPTGLGKTAVMAIWLVARATGATSLPRRLVYVVDRRAVVDQATSVAERLRAFVQDNVEFRRNLGLADHPLPISTLRGQYTDNKDWLEDPASPAIIVGTVDMIGSRLLFEGYGASPKMRPYHAGLLGADTLLVLDEAHLVPPFEKLLETIADARALFGPHSEKLRQLVPSFHLLSLSATGRTSGGRSVGLQQADLQHPVVRRRLDAIKRLTILPAMDPDTRLSDALAQQAWHLAGDGTLPVRVIVFCDKRTDAVAAEKAIQSYAADRTNGTREISTQLFVGGRRVRERENVARWLRSRGFLADQKVGMTRPAFVFATSAGEVGVDLDADHMVGDLVAWERMVQRLGRVNRRGDGDARVTIVTESPSKEVQKARAKPANDRSARDSMAVAGEDRKYAVRQLIERLPIKDGARDASSGAVRTLKMSALSDPQVARLIEAATTPAPLRPALSRALVDAWAMTSLEEHTGRPQIDPWLRGWDDDDPPQTTVIWREHLPVRPDVSESSREIERFFEAAPPHVSEQLETETYNVLGWLTARAKTLGSDHQTIAIALSPAGKVRCKWKLSDLILDDSAEAKKKKEAIENTLNGSTLIVGANFGGLRAGLLDEKATSPLAAADDGSSWMTPDPETDPTSERSTSPLIKFRVQVGEAMPGTDDQRWYERFRFELSTQDEEPRRWLIVMKWRDDSTMEDDRSEGHFQVLHAHQTEVEERVRTLAHQLGLPADYTEMLGAAAAVHDEGKNTPRWQRAFNAPNDHAYAKTPGPINFALLDGYRHEFGSLTTAASDGRVCRLSGDLRELALHLIAAHHGFARPVIRITGCEDSPPSILQGRASEVAFRFASLQKRWGPWGLAWWESLLRAADQKASRRNAEDRSAAQGPA